MNLKVESKPKSKSAKIMVVDDHPIVRQGIAQLINHETDMEFAGEAGDATEAIKTFNKLKPDLVIVDISLKGTSGIELTKNLLSSRPEIPILIMSMYDESVYVERVLKAGAKGYLMKHEATDNVVSAIRKLLKGEVYVSEKMRDSLVHKLIGTNNTKGSYVDNLSDRELEILQLVGQGFSTRQIAEELHVSIKTVESHYSNIKTKLDLKNGHELIQYAVKWSLSGK